MQRTLSLSLLAFLLSALTFCPGCDKPAERYRGELLDGLPHGYGIYTEPGSASYFGCFKEGLRHGKGIWGHPNGTYYLGEWYNDECFGTGTMILSNGAAYSGQWAANMRHGVGIYTWADGRVYRGQWVDDKMYGWGVLRHPDGTHYEGFWQYGLQNGPGILVHPGGAVEKGIWTMGYLVPVAVESIALTPQNATLFKSGKAVTLQVIITPSDATNQAVTWESNNTKVARVENGVVTPVSPGRAVITATTVDGGLQASCAVTVNPDTIAVKGVQLSDQTLYLTAGGAQHTLIATLVPANATNKVVTWSSSNPAAAAISAYGTLTPLAPGETIITVTTLEGRWTATCSVIVSAPPPPDPPPLTPPENGAGG